MSVEYKETFYIVPRRIRELVGMTLGYLDVYETIFQFWNKDLPCYLSNPMISQRTGLKETQIYEALNYFETHGELERRHKGGRRYLVQPSRTIETDSSKVILESAPPDGGVRSTGLQGSALPDYNIKKVNKEFNCTEENFSKPLKVYPISPVDLVRVFVEEFPGHPFAKPSSGSGAYPDSFIKRVRSMKKAYKAKTGFELTENGFREYLNLFKEKAPGYCELINKRTKRKIHMNAFIGEDVFIKFIKGEELY